MQYKLIFEHWKSIEGFEGIYEISDKGRVRRLQGKGCRQERFLKPKRNTCGYFQAQLYKEGTPTLKLIHRLVAEAFIHNPENKDFVNHKNGIKSDNSVSNLEWCTHRENEDHAMLNGLILKGDKHPKSKTNTEDVLMIRKLHKQGFRGIYLSEKFSLSKSHINQIITKKIWKHV